MHTHTHTMNSETREWKQQGKTVCTQTVALCRNRQRSSAPAKANKTERDWMSSNQTNWRKNERSKKNTLNQPTTNNESTAFIAMHKIRAERQSPELLPPPSPPSRCILTIDGLIHLNANQIEILIEYFQSLRVQIAQKARASGNDSGENKMHLAYTNIHKCISSPHYHCIKYKNKLEQQQQQKTRENKQTNAYRKIVPNAIK